MTLQIFMNDASTKKEGWVYLWAVFTVPLRCMYCMYVVVALANQVSCRVA
jgi:hypothetical protein